MMIIVADDHQVIAALRRLGVYGRMRREIRARPGESRAILIHGDSFGSPPGVVPCRPQLAGGALLSTDSRPG